MKKTLALIAGISLLAGPALACDMNKSALPQDKTEAQAPAAKSKAKAKLAKQKSKAKAETAAAPVRDPKL